MCVRAGNARGGGGRKVNGWLKSVPTCERGEVLEGESKAGKPEWCILCRETDVWNTVHHE